MVALLVPAVALPVLAYAAFHEERPGLRRLLALLLLFVGAMELLVIAADLLTLLAGWELVGACSWALIAHQWRDASGAASSLYAFVMTRLGDLGMFLAVMAAFAGSGSFAYAELAQLQGLPLALLTFGLLLSAASKSGQLPFSPWLFRAMAGPTSVSALLHAATMVAAGAYLLARLQPQLSRVAWFGPAVIAIGLSTALAGGVVAIVQSHAKKLLAASTSAHFGLMFVAVGAGYPAVAVAHLVAHACFKAPLFLAAGIAGQRTDGYTLARMRLGRALPWVATMSGVAVLALAGVPPMGAAWTKETIAAAGEHASPWVAAAVLLAGGLSAVYAARFQGLAFGFGDPCVQAKRPGCVERIAMTLLALVTLVLSLLWLPRAHAALGALLGVSWPTSGTLVRVASLLLAGLGLATGNLLVRRWPKLGLSGAPAAVANWWGLPTLLRVSLSTPVLWLAHAAACADDALIDAMPRGAALLGRRAAARFARGDDAVVDRGVRASETFTMVLAAFGRGLGERVADGLPEGTAALLGLGGLDVRRLQTGLSQHYVAMLAIGGALLTVILLLGS
ncbi:NADH-quinone oxidoreductase subunit L [Dyella sp. KRB-257]|uniref:NADH-quinone oxidoreductase subunit 5 family protein n=1 Tax=Dyella sp. KRB-257 TaxID=3400915 RepID=UPI003C0B3512